MIFAYLYPSCGGRCILFFFPIHLTIIFHCFFSFFHSFFSLNSPCDTMGKFIFTSLYRIVPGERERMVFRLRWKCSANRINIFLQDIYSHKRHFSRRLRCLRFFSLNFKDISDADSLLSFLSLSFDVSMNEIENGNETKLTRWMDEWMNGMVSVIGVTLEFWLIIIIIIIILRGIKKFMIMATVCRSILSSTISDITPDTYSKETTHRVSFKIIIYHLKVYSTTNEDEFKANGWEKNRRRKYFPFLLCSPSRCLFV